MLKMNSTPNNRAMDIISKNPSAIKDMEQNEELCNYAVAMNFRVLEFVNEQTRRICVTAISRNIRALSYIREQTLELCQMAIRKDPDAINYVHDNEMRDYLCKTMGIKLFDISALGF